MPFMNQPPGSLLSSKAVMTYGRAIHAAGFRLLVEQEAKLAWTAHQLAT